MTRPKPLILCILDGWGHRDALADNAIAQAKTPHWDGLIARYPHSLLEASEQFVGLPSGQMGNSEVGHMNIGAGRVVMQDLPRIDAAIASDTLANKPRLQQFISNLILSGGTCHIMGLLSPGGVHSHQSHIAALARIVSAAGVPVAIHAFTDGRDTPPQSALEYLQRFEKEIAVGARGDIRFATVSGRYYAMDRDKRWDRVAKAYHAMAGGNGLHRVASAEQAVHEAYARGQMDEFVEPTVIGDYSGFRQGDGLLMANFRADRARQMLHAFLDPGFEGFERSPTRSSDGGTVIFADQLGMVEYSEALNPWIDALFPAESVRQGLGEVVSQAGLRQLRIAETEKYAHVTFFFNGGSEVEYPGEDRILIPSPQVATYDLKPEMSAYEMTEALEEAIAGERYDLIVVNYANTDMVGHSGDLAAAVKAVEAVDNCIGRLWRAVEAKGGALLITADHGNAEQMSDPQTGQPHTAHTTLPVPFVLAAATRTITTVRNGKLADIAPTVLELMGLVQPDAMTGHSLIGR